MLKSIIAALAACAFLLPQAARAQSKTFVGDHYAITFGTGWDSVKTHSVLGKYGGLQGMATMGATLGSGLPDIDSMATSYADSLGGTIKKDSSGRMTLGAYEVHWQKFTYDSLPKLSASISAMVGGLPVNLKNGSFRVYYLNSGGVTFSLACMAVLPGSKAPYTEVESAIATLKLTTQSGIIPLSRGIGDIWVKDGKLGGGWLKANRVFAVECYDPRGAFLGNATHAAEGAWRLPKSGVEMLVRLKTATGAGMHFMVRP
jgi:hypothetical protein